MRKDIERLLDHFKHIRRHCVGDQGGNVIQSEGYHARELDDARLRKAKPHVTAFGPKDS